MNKITISEIKDVPIIQEIAANTWRRVYLDMISKDQIEYMLDLFYNTATLTDDIKTNKQTYLLLYKDNTPIGFASYGAVDAGYKLHKLYCLPDYIGNGYGQQLLEAVEKQVYNLGNNSLILNVNRTNPAKRFYTRAGYTVKEEVDLDIGGGFFMNDYIMEKRLN